MISHQVLVRCNGQTFAYRRSWSLLSERTPGVNEPLGSPIKRHLSREKDLPIARRWVLLTQLLVYKIPISMPLPKFRSS